MTPPTTPSPRRPKAVVVFCGVVAVISVYHLLQFLQVSQRVRILQTTPYAIPLTYLILDGLIWGTSGLVLLWGLWTGRSWARPAGMILAGLYAASRWADLIWAAAPELLPARWEEAAAATLLGLGGTLLLLNARPSRMYFTR